MRAGTWVLAAAVSWWVLGTSPALAVDEDSPAWLPPPPRHVFLAPVPGSDALPVPAIYPGDPQAGTGRFVRRSTASYRIDRDAYRPRGPVEVRDEWLLAQPRLTLPAVSPDPVPRGEWRLRVYVNRGNDFGWDQSGPAESPTDRRFLVDGEHQTTEFGVRYGLMPKLSLGVRVPIRWRGGGFMDSLIDDFHEATADLGTLDNARPFFDRDRYRVEGRDDRGHPLSWTNERGTGLGNVELEAHWNVKKPCCRSDWRAALITRLSLPTATDPYDVGGVDAGLQAVVAKQIHRRWDLYGGAGGTVFGKDTIRGIEYETWRVHGFFAVEYHVSRPWSLVLWTDAASRLVTNLAQYPALTWYIHFAGRWDVSRRVELEIGFTENIEHQQATIDFGAFLGFHLRL